MASIAEDLAASRAQLALVVQKAICKFQRETGFAVNGFDIQHHYKGMDFEPDATQVLSTNITIK